MLKNGSLNFESVDVLRRNMLISVTDWVDLLGMSRDTYYSYMRGETNPTPRREERLRGLLRELVTLVAERGWPSADVMIAKGKDRPAMLRQELDKLRLETSGRGA